MGRAAGPTGWAVVIPVKRLDRAKTRLSTRPAAEREDLALAFARDVVAAARACADVAGVWVVTDDERARAVLAAGDRVTLVADLPDSGLNPALAHGARQVPAGLSVAALSADLPSLRPAELGRALGLAERHRRSFVSDATGVGTTMLTASAGADLDPHFGPRSRARHRESGAVELHPDDVPGLRRDVDTEVDLWDAVRLGVGPATAEVLHRAGARS